MVYLHFAHSEYLKLDSSGQLNINRLVLYSGSISLVTDAILLARAKGSTLTPEIYLCINSRIGFISKVLQLGIAQTLLIFIVVTSFYVVVAFADQATTLASAGLLDVVIANSYIKS